MDGTDALAAIHTAEYFLDLYEYAMPAGEFVEFSKLYGERCEFCDNAIAEVKRLNDNDLHFFGGRMSRGNGMLEESATPSSSIDVYFSVTQEASEVRFRSGRVKEEYPANSYPLRVRLSLDSDNWIVTAVDIGQDAS